MTAMPIVWAYSAIGRILLLVSQPVDGLKQCVPSITLQP